MPVSSTKQEGKTNKPICLFYLSFGDRKITSFHLEAKPGSLIFYTIRSPNSDKRNIITTIVGKKRKRESEKMARVGQAYFGFAMIGADLKRE